MTSVPAEVQGSKRRLVFSLFIGVWLLKLVLGISDVTTRHVPSYPDAVGGSPAIGQMELGVVIPSAFLALNLLLFALAKRLPKWLAIVDGNAYKCSYLLHSCSLAQAEFKQAGNPEAMLIAAQDLTSVWT